MSYGARGVLLFVVGAFLAMGAGFAVFLLPIALSRSGAIQLRDSGVIGFDLTWVPVITTFAGAVLNARRATGSRLRLSREDVALWSGSKLVRAWSRSDARDRFSLIERTSSPWAAKQDHPVYLLAGAESFSRERALARDAFLAVLEAARSSGAVVTQRQTRTRGYYTTRSTRS